jgi:hypothetical protein
VNPTERRALMLLAAGLAAAIGMDFLLSREPDWLVGLLGKESIEDLLAAGREEPPLPLAGPGIPPSASPSENPQLRARIDRKLPYDEAGRLNLNLADSSELVLLRGVGPVLAGRILEQRRRLGGFEGTGDLLGVRGIGPRTLAKLLPQRTLGAARDSIGTVDP